MDGLSPGGPTEEVKSERLALSISTSSMQASIKRVERVRSRKKNLTQSRLRPVSPFSYVGRGRKGAKIKRRGLIAAKDRKERKEVGPGKTVTGQSEIVG
jgi:hypothetical protein